LKLTVIKQLIDEKVDEILHEVYTEQGERVQNDRLKKRCRRVLSCQGYRGVP